MPLLHDDRPAILHPAPRAPDPAHPVHGWPGSLYILLTWIAGGGALVTAALLLIPSYETGGGDLPRAAALGAAGVGELLLARALSRFSRWGWWAAMIHVGLTAAAVVRNTLLVPEPVVLAIAAAMLALQAVWLRYFWTRREDFDVRVGME